MLAIVEKNNGLFHGNGNFAIFSFFFFLFHPILCILSDGKNS